MEGAESDLPEVWNAIPETFRSIHVNHCFHLMQWDLMAHCTFRIVVGELESLISGNIIGGYTAGLVSVDSDVAVLQRGTN